jgi:hypothetical protein
MGKICDGSFEKNRVDLWLIRIINFRSFLYS